MKDNKKFINEVASSSEGMGKEYRINIGNHSISRKDLEDIRDDLGESTSVTEIHAPKIRDEEGNLPLDIFEVLLEIIGKSPNLKKLTLSENTLDYTSIAYLMFTLSLKFKDEQIELHLSHCGLDEASVQMLLTSPNIKELHIHGYGLKNLEGYNLTAGKVQEISVVSGRSIFVEREEVVSSPEEELYSKQWSDINSIGDLNIEEDTDIPQSAREVDGGKEEEQGDSWQSRCENASPSDLEDKENIDPKGITPIISKTKKEEFSSGMQKILRDGPKSPTQYAQKKEFSESNLGM